MNQIDYRSLLLDIPADTYHEATRAGKFLSSHMLGDFRSCPFLYHQKLTGEIAPTDSAAFTIGRAAHVLICEGRAAFDEAYIVTDGPRNPKTGEPFGKATKAYGEWLSSQDRTVISGKDFHFLTQLQAAVWTHPEASELLDNGVAEGTVRAEYAGIPCQIRMDFYNPQRGIIDLKTCENLDFFEYDARRYGYIHQLAFYRAIWRAASTENAPVYIIAVEKREPHRCGVWAISEDTLDRAESQNVHAIERLHQCRETHEWPTDYEGLRVLDL